MNSFLDNRPAIGRKDGLMVAPQHQSGFQSFFTSRESIQTPEEFTASETAAAEHESPKIELVQKDGKVEKIIITCSCCKRIELECSY